MAMCIKSRIDDAQTLWAQGRHEGAFLCALVAVAATSRRIYPHPKHKDSEAFEAFLNQGVFGRLSVEFRGKALPAYRIFYKWIRCQLAHEGALPSDLHFVPDSLSGPLTIRAGGAPEFKLLLSQSWFHELVHTVITAPINADIFPIKHTKAK